MDVERAADLYAQGWSLRQIGAELGLSEATLSDRLRRAGATMRRGGPLAHPASTQQILQLCDQGLTWSEVASRTGRFDCLGCVEPSPEDPATEASAPLWP